MLRVLTANLLRSRRDDIGLDVSRKRRIAFRCAIAVVTAQLGLCAEASEKSITAGLPVVSEVREKNHSTEVPDASLFAFEDRAREEFLGADAPDDLFLFANSPSSIQLWDPKKYGEPRELLTVRIKRKSGTLTSSTDFGEKRTERRLSADEVRAIREFAEKNNPDKLPRLESERMVNGHKLVVASGTIYVYLHLTSRAGHRVWINNPPTITETDYPSDHPAWKHTKLVDFFSGLTKNEKTGP